MLETPIKASFKNNKIQKWMIIPLNFESGIEVMDEWLGDNSEPRKKYILKNKFSITDI